MNASQEFDFVEQLAEEFSERLRNGEKPTIQEYVDQYPNHAELIRDTFEALVMMENLAPGSEDSFGQESLTGQAVVGIKEIEKLGDFRIIGEVGRGGMGIVYEAEQVSLGRHVALKVLPSTALPDDKHVRRFEREAKSAAKLHHTNIVPVFGVGKQDDLHYYVMQFIQGLPLDEVIDELKKIQAQPTGAMTSNVSVEKTGSFHRQQSAADVAQSLINGQFAETFIGESGSDDGSFAARRKPDGKNSRTSDSSAVRRSESMNLTGSLSGSTLQLGQSGVHSPQQKPMTYWQSVANIGAQVADALHYAHDQGILHRDIKPSNLLLDLRGTTWVTDFGLAKATDQQDITHTGDILGTLRYMPPEAFDGLSDARSDVYSLGLSLYELLAFQPAFNTHDRHQLIKLVTTESAPRLDKLNPNIPRDLVTIIHKAIDRDQTHRYQSAEEIQHDLQRFLADEPIKARRISLAERMARWSRRNKGLAVSLAAICALVLFINIAGPMMYWQLAQQKEALDDNLIQLAKSREQERLLNDEKLQQVEGRLRAEENEQAAIRAEMAANQERAELADELKDTNRDLEEKIGRQRRDIYAGAILQVAHELERGNPIRMREILLSFIPTDADETDLRGPEWYYWWNFLNQSEETGHLVTNFGETVPEVVILPGGDLVAVGSKDQIDVYQRNEAGFQLSEKPSFTVPTKMAGDSYFRNPMTAAGLIVDDLEAQDPGFFAPSPNYKAPSDNFRVWTSNEKEARQFEYPRDELAHVSFMAVSPDSRRVAVLGVSSELSDVPICKLLLWDVATQKLLANLERPGELNRIKFNQDGTLLAAYLCHSSLRLEPVERDVVVVFQLTEQEGQTQAKQIAVARHHDDVDSVYFFPDRPEMLLSTLGFSNKRHTKEYYRWKIGNDEPVERFGQETPPSMPIAEISPDGKLFAVSSPYQATIQLIDTQTGQVARTLYNPQGDKITSLTFTPTGDRLIACGTGPRSAAVLEWPLQSTDWYSLQSSPIDLTATGSTSGQRTLAPVYAISPDLSLLAHVDQQGLMVRRRDGKTWPAIQVTSSPLLTLKPFRHLQISPDNRLLADYRMAFNQSQRVYDSEVRLFEIDLEGGVTLNGSPIEIPGVSSISTEMVRTVFQNLPEMAFTGDGRLLVKRWGSVHAIDLESHKVTEITLLESLAQSDLVQRTQLSSPMVTNTAGQAFVAALQPIASDEYSGDSVSSTDNSETTSNGLTVHILDATSGTSMGNQDLAFEGNVLEELRKTVAGTMGRHAAVLWKKSSRIQICDFGTGNPVWELTGDGLVFSPDESLVAVFSNEEDSVRIRTVSIWDVSSRNELSQFNLIGTGAEEVRFSPDSQRLFTLHGMQPSTGADIPAEVRIWDARSDHELWSIPVGHANHYYWDLAIDSTSNRSSSLATFILAKERVGKESSVAKVFDLSAMSKEEETQRIAGPLVQQLFEEHLLKPEILSKLQSKVHPLIQSNVEQLVNAYPDDDLDAVIHSCLNRIIDRYTNPDSAQYQRWAEVLENWYPNDPRTRLMAGIAEYYNGNPVRALELLSPDESPGTRSTADLAAEHDVVRLEFRTLALLRANQPGQAEESARDLCRTLRTEFGFNCLAESLYQFRSQTESIDFGKFLNFVLREQMEAHECAIIGKDCTPQEMAKNILSILDLNSDGRLTQADSMTDWDDDHKLNWASLSGLDSTENGGIDVEELTQMTTVLADGADYRGATVDYYTQGLLSSPLNSQSWNSRARYWRALNQYDRALADCEQGLRLTQPTDGQHAGLLNFRGSIHLDRKDYPAAMEVFRQVTELDPDFAAAWNNLGVCLDRLKRPEESIPYYTKAIELNPNFTNINNRATRYLTIGKPVEALADLTKLIGLASTADNYVKRGDVHLVLKNYDEAIADFDKALKLDREQEALNEKRLLAYAQKGDTASAAEILIRALDTAPDINTKLDCVKWVAELGLDLTKVLADRDESPLLLAALARKNTDSTDRQQILDRALQLAQDQCKTHPDSEIAAGVLARVKMAAWKLTSDWSVLDPAEIHSAGGATLTKLEDGSVLASGPLVDQEVYTITVRPKQKEITSILLETMPDPNLPFGRSGRELRLGNFLISSFNLSVHTDAGDSSAQAIPIGRIASDCPGRVGAKTSWIENMLGRGPAFHWTAWPDVHVSHRVVFELLEPMTVPDGGSLQITIDCSDPKFPGRTLGRFRLSCNHSENTFEEERERLTAMQIENPWHQLAAVFHVEGKNAELDQLLARHPTAGLGIAHMHAKSGMLSEMNEQLQNVINSRQQTDIPPEENAQTLRACAALYISEGLWKEGADTYAESVQLDPESTSLDWMRVAALYAYGEDHAGLQSFCRTMADHFRTSKTPADAERTVKSMLLMGGPLIAELEPQQFPVKAFLDSVDRKTMHASYHSWFLATRALLACRSEQFGALFEAEQWLDQSKSGTEFSPSYAGLFQRGVQVLILAKQGHSTQARELSEELRRILKSEFSLMWNTNGTLDGRTILNNDRVVHDLLIPEILRREAERLIKNPDTNPKPSSNDDQL